MLKNLILSLLLITYIVANDDVIDEEDPEDEVVTDEEIAEESETKDDGRPKAKPGEQMISYSQPSLTEEEQKSHHFPARYRCEACQIVVHNLGTRLKTAESKLPKKQKKRTLGDVAVIDIFEDICTKDGFEGYSIQEFDGKVTFKGPAFPDRKAPGMSMGGGLWPVRYVNYCGGLFEDFDEDEVYQFYRSGNLFAELCLKNHCKDDLSSTPKPVDIKPADFGSSKDEL